MIVAGDIWLRRALFCIAVFALLAFRMIPPGTHLAFLPQPDVLFCVMATWIIRRPELVPPWLVAALVFTSEILFLQVPGLWSAIVVIATEYLRTQVNRLRHMSFAYEWLHFSVSYTVGALTYQFIAMLAFMQTAPADRVILDIVFTVLAYPLLVALANLVFRVQKISKDGDSIFGVTTK